MKKILLLCTFLCCSIPAKADFADAENYFTQQDFSRAFSEFLPLANNGDFRSQYYVGYLYLNGLGVSQDTREAVRYLKESSSQNYDMAQALLAFLYEEGHAVPQDKSKAMELYKLAAAQNNASANLNLGVMYYNGSNVEKDHRVALEYFKKVPLEEKPIVARYIGDIYLNNADLKDYKNALFYYSAAATTGDLDAFFALGEIHRKGLGVPKSVTKALPYYKYAASKGYAPAQYMLGIIFANGDGVTRDVGKAYAWISFAAEQKFINAEKAMDQLSSSMSISDFDQARRQIALIQDNEMGKMAMPVVAKASLKSEDDKKVDRVSRRRRRGVRASSRRD